MARLGCGFAIDAYFRLPLLTDAARPSRADVRARRISRAGSTKTSAFDFTVGWNAGMMSWVRVPVDPDARRMEAASRVR
jgi:hypothetical protein